MFTLGLMFDKILKEFKFHIADFCMSVNKFLYKVPSYPKQNREVGRFKCFQKSKVNTSCLILDLHD